MLLDSRTLLRVFVALFFFATLITCQQDDLTLTDQGPDPARAVFQAELFGARLASNNDNRHSPLAFSPDGTELFYSVYVDNQHPQTVFHSKQINGDWGEPAVASFSGIYKDGGPLLSPDGNRLYFYSDRPRDTDSDTAEHYDIWYVERTTDGWGKAVRMGDQVNTDDDESTYTLSGNGDLFFNRRTQDARNFLLRSNNIDGNFQPPTIIKELSDQETFFEPVAVESEDHFIFTNNVQKGRFFYTALYISFRNKDGSWSAPKDMGDMVNFGEGRFPSFSPDGRYFYFLSYRTGVSQYYRVDATIIDYLKTEDLDLIKQLTTTALEHGFNATRTSYEALSRKYATAYHFDQVLLNEVASELISTDATDTAIDVYRLNFGLYPDFLFYPQKLVVSLLEKDTDAFNNIASVIERQPETMHQDLLDEINVAGEIFLRKGRVDDAIRIFELNARINPDSNWPFYKLGKAYYQLEDHETARNFFHKTLRLDPNNIYARNYLEEIGFPQLTGPYLGQEPPGMTPEKFATGVFSANDGDTINSVFSPDGNEFYYVFLEDESPRYNLWFTRIEAGAWSKPQPLLASDKYSVADIALSPDGNRLYFCSDMPTYWDDAEGFDIWFVERTEDGWSEPLNAGKNINTRGGETQPSFTTDGSMYFPSWTNNTPEGDVDIFYAPYVGGEFSERIPLEGGVNSIHSEGNSFVAPDGSYILFARWGMPEHIDGGKGLYISFRNPDGSWGESINTEPVLPVRGSLAALTHDGKYLLWSTPQGTHWVDVRALEKLRPGN